MGGAAQQERVRRWWAWQGAAQPRAPGGRLGPPAERTLPMSSGTSECGTSRRSLSRSSGPSAELQLLDVPSCRRGGGGRALNKAGEVRGPGRRRAPAALPAAGRLGGCPWRRWPAAGAPPARQARCRRCQAASSTRAAASGPDTARRRSGGGCGSRSARQSMGSAQYERRGAGCRSQPRSGARGATAGWEG